MCAFLWISTGTPVHVYKTGNKLSSVFCVPPNEHWILLVSLDWLRALLFGSELLRIRVRDTIPNIHFRFCRISGTQIQNENTICAQFLVNDFCVFSSSPFARRTGTRECWKFTSPYNNNNSAPQGYNSAVGLVLTVIVTDAHEIYTFPVSSTNRIGVKFNLTVIIMWAHD